jgi:beta-galactosidase/beta-glucuronidase
MYPHRIHLRGPWDHEPLAWTVLDTEGRSDTRAAPVPPGGRMTMPCRWSDGGLGPFAGRVRFRRRFHWPGRLDYYERLWLTFAGADYFATVSLNGQLLGHHTGAFDPFEFDITALIRPRNDLIVDVDLPAAGPAGDRQWLLRGSRHCAEHGGGLWGTVAVEVRREVFLRGLRLWASFAGAIPALHVAGEVVGVAERPLELHVRCSDRTALHDPVEAGKPFHLAADQPDVERWQPRGHGPAHLHTIRVELIDTTGKLDQASRPFGFRDVRLTGRDDLLLVNGREVVLRTEEPDPSLFHTDLLPPDHRDDFLDQLDRAGQLVWLHLPLRGGYADAPELRAEAIRQVSAIVPLYQHHPSLIGWHAHTDPQPHDAALDEALERTLRELDPERPCRYGTV